MFEVYSDSVGNATFETTGLTGVIDRSDQSITINGTTTARYPQVQLIGSQGVLRLVPNKTYTVSIASSNAPENAYVYILIQGYINNGWETIKSTRGIATGTFSFTKTYANYRYILVWENTGLTYNNTKTRISIVEGEVSSFIPFGYQLPLTVTSGAQSQDYPLYIGSTKLGEEEYVDYGEQKVWKKKPNLISDVLSGVSVSADGTLTRNAALNGAVTPIEQGRTYTMQYARNSGNMICGFYENYPEVNTTTYDGSRLIWNGSYHTFIAPIDGYLISSCTPTIIDPIVYEGEYPQLTPVDPPVPLPEILTYQGENTLSSTETLGEATIKGRINELPTQQSDN